MNDETRDGSSRLHINTTWPPRGQARRTIIGTAAAAAAAGTIMVLSAGGASAAPNAPALAPLKQHQVICHRTHSNHNPYVQINPNVNSSSSRSPGTTRTMARSGTRPQGPAHQVGRHHPAVRLRHEPGEPLPGQELRCRRHGDLGEQLPHPEAPVIDASGVDTTAVHAGRDHTGRDHTVETTPVETTPVETTPVETTPASHSISGSSVHSTSHSNSHGISASSTHSTSNGPIPEGVSAGLHTPIANAGLRAWGIVLMVLGGAAGLLAGLWPTRRRAH